jgi:hypothetical protein
MEGMGPFGASGAGQEKSNNSANKEQHVEPPNPLLPAATHKAVYSCAYCGSAAMPAAR